MPDAFQAVSVEDTIAENFDPTPRAEAVGEAEGFAAIVGRTEPAPRTTELPGTSDEDIYDLRDDARERENAEVREAFLAHEIFARNPRLKGKQTLLNAAAKALEGTGQLSIRNGSRAELVRVAELIEKTASGLLNEISKEVSHASQRHATAVTSGGSFPPGHFARFAAREPKAERFVDTIKRAQFERGLYADRPSNMSNEEANRIERARLARRGEVRPVWNG